MASSLISPEQQIEIAHLVAEYISAQRENFRPLCKSLTQTQRSAIDGFFTAELLDQVRVLVLHSGRISNPPFYSALLQMGLRGLPDFSMMAAITFQDIVVSHEEFCDGLLFHEMVHVEQYRQLGVQRFAELYVRGFLGGGGYDGIPLEVNAYSLQAEFESNPGRRFSAANEVAAWARAGRF